MNMRQILSMASQPYKTPAAKKARGQGTLLNFTLLTEDQIWGDENGNGQLDVMKKYGTCVAPTDLTVLLGSCMDGIGYRTSEGDLACISWSASPDEAGLVRCVNCAGTKDGSIQDMRYSSVRPVLPPSQALEINPRETGIADGIRVVEYGEYPQTVVSERTSEKLEKLHQSGSLHPTGKNYTFDSVDVMEDTPFKAISYLEYEMDGKKYIRVPSRSDGASGHLSTGERAQKGKPYWVEVQPIEWLMDPSGTMIAKKSLFAGIPFGTGEEVFYDGDFSKTFMKKYLDTYFAKEMQSTERRAGYGKQIETEQRKRERKEKLEEFKAELREASDLKKIKRGLRPARTPERLEEAAHLTRARRTRDISVAAIREAQEGGDSKLVNEMIDAAYPYAFLDQEVRYRFRQKLAARRAERLAARRAERLAAKKDPR